MLRVGRQQRRDALRPLDHGHTVGAGQIFLDAEADRLALAADAVEVDVVERQAPAAVLVDEGEGGAGHVAPEAEAAGETLDELRLAGAEHAAQREHVAGAQAVGPARGEGLRRLNAA